MLSRTRPETKPRARDNLSSHLGPGLPGCLRLGCHGSLQLHRESDVLHLDPLHPDAPGVRGLVQQRLHHVGDGVPLTQDLRQVLCAEDIAKRGGCQQSGGVTETGIRLYSPSDSGKSYYGNVIGLLATPALHKSPNSSKYMVLQPFTGQKNNTSFPHL